MLENVSEGDKLNVCNVIFESIPTEERKKYGGKQKFLETCIEQGIALQTGKDESRTMKLAESINKMADALEVALNSGFNRKLLVLFVHDALGRDIGKTKIEMVLDAVMEFIDETQEA